MTGALVGVGVGPGDPELLTLKGLKELREADTVFVPVGDTGEIGRAEAVVGQHLPPESVRRLLFALSDDMEARERNWDLAADEVCTALSGERSCAFATIGDPNVYSTFTYLWRAVLERLPGTEVRTVPGITAMQDLASRSGTVLLEGTERLTLMPFNAGESALREALAASDTVVCYKGGGRLSKVLTVADEAGRLEEAVYGSRLGMQGEEVRPASEATGEKGPYLSTVIFTSREARES